MRMRKFTVGLLAMLVACIFIISPVSASVKKITMSSTRKTGTSKEAIQKDIKPAKNTGKGKTTTKLTSKTINTKTTTLTKDKLGSVSAKKTNKSVETKRSKKAKIATAKHAYNTVVAQQTSTENIFVKPTYTVSSTIVHTKPQSASITPPISSFGKPSNSPTTFNTPTNASPPIQRPIDVNETPNGPETRAKAALVLDENNLKILYERNSTSPMPMASITKLMTALVVVEAMQDMKQILEISTDDIDHIKGTSSRLKIGTRLTRGEMLHLALMSSENRAASALGRYYPGGKEAFINAMNLKAAILGMTNTHYVDSNGLSPQNVSCARDLAKLVMATAEYPLIRKYSTAEYHTVYDGEKNLSYGSTNRLTHSSNWKIQVQKTGYIREAGKCLVMKTTIDSRPIVMVLLNVNGPKGAHFVDAQHIKGWLTHDTASIFNSRGSSNKNTFLSEDDFYN